MDYLIAVLIIFTLANLVYLTRAVAKAQKDIQHIKSRLCGGKEEDNG